MKEMSPPEEAPCIPALAGSTLGLISPTLAVNKLGPFPTKGTSLAHPTKVKVKVKFLDTPWNSTHCDGEMHRPEPGADLLPTQFH